MLTGFKGSYTIAPCTSNHTDTAMIHRFFSARLTVSTMLLLAFMVMAGCKSTKIILPTVSENAANIQLQGKFVWFDLYTTDMTSASNFYDALFGWDFERTNDLQPQVKTIFHRGKPIGNMFGRDAEPGDSEWISSLSVPEVSVMTEMVEELGGTVQSPPKVMPDRGVQAVVLDAQGAKIALLTSSTGDPMDTPFAINRWMGSELWTSDPTKATTFYVHLAQYTPTTMDEQTSMPYTLLSTKGHPRATINASLQKSTKPQWVPLILVNNLLNILTRVEKLGGTVLLPPDPAFRKGQAAIIQDPSGAMVSIQQAARHTSQQTSP